MNYRYFSIFQSVSNLTDAFDMYKCILVLLAQNFTDFATMQSCLCLCKRRNHVIEVKSEAENTEFSN